MDIYCPVKNCGEPWDIDTLHDVAEDTDKTYDEVAELFRRKGCEAIYGMKHNIQDVSYRDKTYGLTAADAASALYDILGDDMDGAAAMLEDMGF